MNRREALSAVALLLGGTIIGADAFLSGCKASDKKAGELFSTNDVALLDEVGETILPATASSPGAKEAKIGEFMKVIVTDCYDEDDQKTFTDGISKLKDASQKKYNKDFMELSAQEKHDLLVGLDKEAIQHQKEVNERAAKLSAQQRTQSVLDKNKGSNKKVPEDAPHYFAMMKQLTLWGYFTSEPGATKALRYIETPGKYEGSIPYKKGDKAWAT